MQYFLSSSFVSLVSSINIAFFILTVVTGCPAITRHWPLTLLLQFITCFCGVLLNCFALLQSKRKLETLNRNMKKLAPYMQMVGRMFTEFYGFVKDFVDAQISRTKSSDFCYHFGFHGLVSYLRSAYTDNFGIRNKKVVKGNFHTPNLNVLHNQKVKAQSDPVKRTEKFSFKANYLPAKSPELFKNKIYLTRRNLTNAMDD